jgi:polysulfide reductase-like protein
MTRARERSMVERANFESYYGRPILKPPAWRQPDVPLYLFLGGTAGACASIAALAEPTGRHALARATRLVAAGGAAASVLALVHDLGRPLRFLNMLRVFKPTSPLSVGSWILAPFSGLTAATAALEVTGRLPRIRRLTGAAAGVLGPAMCTYTAVLLSDTATPAWHEARHDLPVLFAGSALASGAGAALLSTPPAEAAPARRIGLAGAVAELVAGRRVERHLGLVSETYRTGRAGTLLKAARVLTAAGAGLTLAGRRSRLASAAAGAAYLAAGAATRFGVYRAGIASTEDPRYVVVPQRARLGTSTEPTRPTQ